MSADEKKEVKSSPASVDTPSAAAFSDPFLVGTLNVTTCIRSLSNGGLFQLSTTFQ